ncbi:hypothetical protein [Pseudoclavibacter sp. VKM Ac-2867]|uniref:hypothetical protein n=1 Tax=Pseudoclavibacter sp. VKM Ac-2867 TaxID=2783829 RepID=UPI00188A26FF|nr:hypothetical protein [Pseudoclavibacter sp. VKM Ac-2867]MBF4458085.1 hypothetical protein [Pseudoclavibacter sp. VKM Ac-2867]
MAVADSEGRVRGDVRRSRDYLPIDDEQLGPILDDGSLLDDERLCFGGDALEAPTEPRDQLASAVAAEADRCERVLAGGQLHERMPNTGVPHLL